MLVRYHSRSATTSHDDQQQRAKEKLPPSNTTTRDDDTHLANETKRWRKRNVQISTWRRTGQLCDEKENRKQHKHKRKMTRFKTTRRSSTATPTPQTQQRQTTKARSSTLHDHTRAVVQQNTLFDERRQDARAHSSTERARRQTLELCPDRRDLENTGGSIVENTGRTHMGLDGNSKTSHETAVLIHKR